MYVFSFTLHLLEIFIFQIVPKYDSIPFRTSYKFLTDSTSPGGGGGYSLYSDDRDDRRIFWGCNRRFSIF